LERLTSLDLHSERLDNTDLTLLLRSPHLTRLRALDLSNNAITDTGVKVLLASGMMERLTSLNLTNNPVSQWSLVVLAGSPLQLRLDWSDRPYGKKPMGDLALARSERWAELTTLDLSKHGLREPAVRFLLASAHFDRVTRLILDGNEFSLAGVTTLVL